MADVKEKKQPAPKQGGKGKEKATTGPVDSSPKVSEGTPRLLTHYMETVRPRLQREFDLANPNQVPRLDKIVLNVGIGEAPKNPKLVDVIVEELSSITGQRAVV